MRTTRTAFIVKLKEHHPESWEEFVSTHHGLFVAIIRRNGVPESDVGDIVQEVFVRLYQVLPRFEYQRSKGSFQGWLNRVVINSITDWRRKHSRRERTFDESIDVPKHTASQRNRLSSDTALTLQENLIDEAIGLLKERINRNTWACFEEHALKGRCANDVAFELSMSVNAVYVNTSRVMSQLREFCLARSGT